MSAQTRTTSIYQWHFIRAYRNQVQYVLFRYMYCVYVYRVNECVRVLFASFDRTDIYWPKSFAYKFMCFSGFGVGSVRNQRLYILWYAWFSNWLLPPVGISYYVTRGAFATAGVSNRSNSRYGILIFKKDISQELNSYVVECVRSKPKQPKK